MAAYNYFNPYGLGNQYGTVPTQPSQNYAVQQQPQQGIIWVDGEVGAKAFQMPPGWPAGVPIDLWDTNDTVIYLKSINQIGMPNPIQRIHYTIEDQKVSSLPPQTTSQGYVTKDDFNKFKDEILELLTSNQNGGVIK